MDVKTTRTIDVSGLLEVLYTDDVSSEIEKAIEENTEIAVAIANSPAHFTSGNMYSDFFPIFSALEMHDRPYLIYKHKGIIFRRLEAQLVLPHIDLGFEIKGCDYFEADGTYTIVARKLNRHENRSDYNNHVPRQKTVFVLPSGTQKVTAKLVE